MGSSSTADLLNKGDSILRIAIDACSLVSRPTGVGHFLLAAVNVWSDQRPDIEFLLLAHKPLHADAKAAMHDVDNVHFHLCPTSRWSSNGLWWMLVGFAASARALGATHLWGASGVLPLHGTDGMVKLLTVHDLVFRSLPHTMAIRTRIAYGLLAGHAIRNADHLWAVSNFTAGEIERYYPQRRARRILVGSGLNPWRAQSKLDTNQIGAVAQKYRINERTLLFVGTLEPRKNLAFLLKLMPHLSTMGWRLIVVGCVGWGKSDYAEIVNASDFPRNAVVFCDYLPDIELQALYRCVGFFISTALMEGFGLPHLEAIALGCPVIAAKNSAITEVVGAAGVLISGWNQDEWVIEIEKAFKNRNELYSHTITQSSLHQMHTPVAQLMLEIEMNV
jgi:glycosyltransferase involved in cell wall biosynthesis